MTAETELPSRPLSFQEPEALYRPIAQVAVIAMVFSLLSLLAFAHLYFWAIPPFALVFSLWSSRWVEKARREYAGQLLAKGALFLSVLSLFGAPTKYFTERVLFTREAKAFCDQYLDRILEHDLIMGFVSTVAPWQAPRQMDQASLDSFISRSTQAYRRFTNSAPVEILKGKLNETQVTYLGAPGFGFNKGFYYVALQYRFDVDGQLFEGTFLAKGNTAVDNEWKGRKWYISDANLTPIQASPSK